MDGSEYAGQFVAGLNEGSGVLTFPDGSKYEGNFSKGKYHGFGVYSRADGMKYEGSFDDGKVAGSGKITFADGSVGRPLQEGTWGGRKLKTIGKQQGAVQQAQRAQAAAQKVAADAKAQK